MSVSVSVSVNVNLNENENDSLHANKLKACTLNRTDAAQMQSGRRQELKT